jgi:hypothetical protein
VAAVFDGEHDVAELAHTLARGLEQLNERRQDIVKIQCIAACSMCSACCSLVCHVDWSSCSVWCLAVVVVVVVVVVAGLGNLNGRSLWKIAWWGMSGPENIHE